MKRIPLSRTGYEEAKASGEDVVLVDVSGKLITMEEAKKLFEIMDKLVDTVYARHREKQAKMTQNKNEI